MVNRVIEPKKNSEELIDILENKGVTFNYVTKEEAILFLKKNNNYFKLVSYRKNFPKRTDDDGNEKYYNLDFIHLMELSRMDMRIRYLLIRMCLDIEHSMKVQLIRDIEENPDEDGYDIVEKFLESRDEISRRKVIQEICRNAGSVYYSGLLKKHSICIDSEEITEFPVWAFTEVISFGTFRDFYRFYRDRNHIRDGGMSHLLNKVNKARNASAHNTCMLNNLYSDKENSSIQLNWKLTNFLGNANIGKVMRDSKLSNEVIYQVVSVLYIHQTMVTSIKIQENRYSELNELMKENLESIALYFSDNDLVASTITMLGKIAVYLQNSVYQN